MTTKTRRLSWNLRVTKPDDALVRAASELTGASFSDFVRSASLAEARRVLADRTLFELDEPSWDRLNEMLEREPEVPAGLRDLFAKPSVFE